MTLISEHLYAKRKKRWIISDKGERKQVMLMTTNI